MSEPYLGQIILFAGNFPIRGFAICEGQTLPINQNQALFSIMGTIYGGDGRTNFKLPDMRGRFPLQRGQGPGLPNYALGSAGGNYQHTMSVQEMPPHSHPVRPVCNSEESTTDEPENTFLSIANENIYAPTGESEMKAYNSDTTGGGQSFGIQNPYLAINFLIALSGLFPSRS